MTEDTSHPTDETAGAQPAPELDPRLLEILVCPVTRGPLEYRPGDQELVSHGAKLAYPIRDGVPIMLPDEARSLSDTYE